MSDRALGFLILVRSLVGLVAYFYLMFLSPWALFVIRLSAFLVVAAFLDIAAWIGYVMATIQNPFEGMDLEETDEGEYESSF